MVVIWVAASFWAAVLTVSMAASVASGSPSFLFILGDDIGWGDFGYNNGTAHTPNIDVWARSQGSILMQDMHSGGTVCSPTRATVLTGRNHFRDCVDYVYGCSDMTECVPSFNFAPENTFTVGDAVRAGGKGQYASLFLGKWHLGSFYNDSELYGATVEVAPTATTNCQCRQDWDKNCDLGHYGKPTHCFGGRNPGGGSLQNGCCFNYWWEDSTQEHGVTNLTEPVGPDDSLYLAGAFVNFLAARNGAPFMAQISFHNCHIPFIGTNASRQSCAAGETCRPPAPGAAPYTDTELDYYACLTELDNSVGIVLDALKRFGYYNNTMTWFATDNGPEENCPPEGICQGTEERPLEGPGSSGPLRGRKRDIYEGGHRVPGIISWPAMVQGNRESWDTVVTYDFLPTVMEVLGVQRPVEQQSWGFDGVSVLPILRGEAWPARGHGWMFDSTQEDPKNGYGFRYGNWKYVQGSVSCKKDDCAEPQLFDLSTDLGERINLATQHPTILQAIMANFTLWHQSILNSIANESKCNAPPPSPPPVPPSADCQWMTNSGLEGLDFAKLAAQTREACCGLCRAVSGCAAADFDGSQCHLKHTFDPKSRDGSTACVPNQ